MQLQVWCLSEGGQVIGKTIRDRDWEEHEKNGYVKNPFHLPDSVSRICEHIIKHNILYFIGDWFIVHVLCHKIHIDMIV